MLAIEKKGARSLIRACIADAEARYSKPVVWGLRKLVTGIHFACGNVFGGDINVWAEASGMSRDELVFANLNYELTQTGDIGGGILGRLNLMGCTAAAYNLPGRRGVCHVRHLDWALEACGPFTRIIEFQGACGPFISVGWPGFVSVLSGIAPGRYSASINQAPSAGRVSLQWPAAFALRNTFETCSTFDDAVRYLKTVELAASVLFMVVGTKVDEAVVIERTCDSAALRWMKKGTLALANHFDSRKFKVFNMDADVVEGVSSLQNSYNREILAAEAVESRPNIPIHRLAKVLAGPTLCCDSTRQRLAFCAKTGEIAVYARQ